MQILVSRLSWKYEELTICSHNYPSQNFTSAVLGGLAHDDFSEFVHDQFANFVSHILGQGKLWRGYIRSWKIKYVSLVGILCIALYVLY